MTDIAGAVFNIGTSIVARADQVKINKHSCRKLAAYCNTISQRLNNGEYGPLTKSEEDYIQKIIELCVKDITKYSGSAYPARWINAPSTAPILDDHYKCLVIYLPQAPPMLTAREVQQQASQNARVEDRMYRNQRNARENISSQVPSTNNWIPIIDSAHLIREMKVEIFPLGTIYKGTYHSKPVYIREIRDEIDGALFDNIKDCVVLNNYLDSPNILHVLGICQGRMIVTDAPVHGPLSEYHVQDSLQKVIIARKIADAIMYMHDIGDIDNRVVHRDIRAANILLDDGLEGLEPKITGFEMCKVGRYTGKEPEIKDCYKRWWSPERINGNGTSTMSDVYAFGVLMYEISTGKEPDSGDLAKTEGMRICEEYTKLMERCRNSRFLLRPTMKEVLDELTHIETRWASQRPTREP
ncbi:hypothetical protein BGX27_008604 [Mortierella sp. AM989]|nr:hypothetical protein BGX27_008604 [Mortierella sp. AM989]